MEEFDRILQSATASVDPRYFSLSIDGGESVLRERVYCYELYHQMRVEWPNDCRYLLTGEVDKRAHPILRTLGADGKQPDLLVHNPGHMEDNFAILEIKHSLAAEGIRKDLHTLDLFLSKVKYTRGIYLIYGGWGTEEVGARIMNMAKEAGYTTPIEVWLQPRVGESAHMYSKLD